MTIQRKNPDTKLNEQFKIRADGVTLTWRSLITLLLLSATPFGQQFLQTVGIKTPAASVAQNIYEDVADVRADIHALKTDVAGVKQQVKTLSASVSVAATEATEAHKRPN